jgi:glycosyltransferase involved in cell wall biosynthesis
MEKINMNNKKRPYHILFCSTGLSYGGEQKQLAKVLSHLDREHFEPIICCIRPLGDIDAAISVSGAKIISLQVQNSRNLLRAVGGLIRVIKKHNIDLIQMGIFGADFAGLLAAIFTRIPMVAFLTTTYDYNTRAAASNTKSFTQLVKWRAICLMHMMLAKVVKGRYIAYSEVIKQSAVSNLHLPTVRVIVTPIGLNAGEFDRSLLSQWVITHLRENLDLDEAYPVLINVARLSPVKGQKELLEAMPQILKQFPNTKLLLAGDGPLLDELALLQYTLGLQKQVLLLGRRDDIAALLAVSDIFVFSSYYEGLPGAIVEAMAAGKPVVAFDIPSLREVVKDGFTGFLIGERNVGRLGEDIIHLAKHPEIAREMGERARQIVCNRFDICSNIKTLETIYGKLIKQRNKAK